MGRGVAVHARVPTAITRGPPVAHRQTHRGGTRVVRGGRGWAHGGSRSCAARGNLGYIGSVPDRAEISLASLSGVEDNSCHATAWLRWTGRRGRVLYALGAPILLLGSRVLRPE